MNDMMKLLDIICVLVVHLLLVKVITGNETIIKFDSSYYYKNPVSSNWKNIKMLPAYANYEVILKGFTTANSSRNEMHPIKKSIEVNCNLLISFNSKKEGIYTCQDKDGDYYLVPSSVNINLRWNSTGYNVTCTNYLGDIIEGEEMQISCQIKLGFLTDFKQGDITVGWIQGQHNLTASYLVEPVINFTQTFIGFQSGEGIFFYCLTNSNKKVVLCYTLILKVLSKLEVKIWDDIETSQTRGHRCFKCQATCGSNEKVYNWTLNDLKLTNNENQDEICFKNLTAGNYTVKCLVSTIAQNSSDAIEFTVKDMLKPEMEDIDTKKNVSRYVVITLAVTTTVLVITVLIQSYFLIRKRESHAPPAVLSHQPAVDTSVCRASRASEVDPDGRVYYTIQETSAEPI